MISWLFGVRNTTIQSNPALETMKDKGLDRYVNNLLEMAGILNKLTQSIGRKSSIDLQPLLKRVEEIRNQDPADDRKSIPLHVAIGKISMALELFLKENLKSVPEEKDIMDKSEIKRLQEKAKIFLEEHSKGSPI